MRNLYVSGYLFAAALYLAAWWRPTGGTRNALVQWASVSKLGVTEFLTLHATTFLSGFVLAAHERPDNPQYRAIFWALCAFYGLLAAGAYAYHRDHRALLGFYLLIVIRTGQLLSNGPSAEPDVMRSIVLKNFLMTVPLMILFIALATAEPMGRGWQDRFLQSRTLGERIRNGRALLFATTYYVLWAFVESKWPERMKP